MAVGYAILFERIGNLPYSGRRRRSSFCFAIATVRVYVRCIWQLDAKNSRKKVGAKHRSANSKLGRFVGKKLVALRLFNMEYL
jgi:hypothetical protein